MSAKMPAVSGPALIRALQRAGFAVARQSGSHIILEHQDGRFASIPVHGKREIPIGTLRGILARIGFDAEDLRRIL